VADIALVLLVTGIRQRGQTVMNRVNRNWPLDEELYAQAREAFAEEFEAM
jgi:hypothetical protein